MNKICHLTTMHPVFDTRIFKKECASLEAAGYEVSLIAPHDKAEKVDGINIIPINKHQSFLDRVYSLPKKTVQMLDGIEADIIHFHDPELLPHMASWAKKTGRAVVWDAHESYKDTIENFNSLKIKPVSILGARFLSKYELSIAQKYFAGVVTVTDKFAKKYRDNGIETCVLSNYADIDKYNYDGTPNLSEKPRLISSGAQFRPRAVLEIAQAYELIQQKMDVEVYFTGRFSQPGLEDEVRTILRKTDPSLKQAVIEGSVEFDYMINEAIPKAWVGVVLMDTSDPNNRNGLPNRFFECWANGVPVIATRNTLIAEIVEAENGGIVIDNNHPEEITAAFLEICKSKEYRNELGNNGYQAVLNKYNWQTNFQDLLRFYEKILNENSNRIRR